MYYHDNEIDYKCENKKTIYIIKYFPVHYKEIFNTLNNLPNEFFNEIKTKKRIVFTSW